MHEPDLPFMTPRSLELWERLQHRMGKETLAMASNLWKVGTFLSDKCDPRQVKIWKTWAHIFTIAETQETQQRNPQLCQVRETDMIYSGLQSKH